MTARPRITTLQRPVRFAIIIESAGISPAAEKEDRTGMEIRHSAEKDLEAMKEIYRGARAFMAEHGNPRQWAANGWPPEELLVRDIQRGKSYVCVNDAGRVIGTFYYDFGPDIEPGYRDLEGGAWRDPSAYGVVHRLAVNHSEKGIGTFCLDWAFAQSGHLRADTHGDNTVMQSLFRKLGFQETGIIHVTQDNDPRIAFEK